MIACCFVGPKKYNAGYSLEMLVSGDRKETTKASVPCYAQTHASMICR